MAARVKKSTVRGAKAGLSRVGDRTPRGHDVVIHRGPVPDVQIAPTSQTIPERRFGAMKGRFTVPDSFFDPHPEDELTAWER
jgi:antitoxin (DNA-binding transcriptional repressor) of toxin-antitoxin stability system